MNESAAVRSVMTRLRAAHGMPLQVGKSRIIKFGSVLTCSINYSKLLRGQKFFFGLAQDVPNPEFAYPKTRLGDYVLLICGSADKVLFLPRPLIVEALRGVSTRKVDVFVEEGAYVLQTTQHPKLDVTHFLNAFPKATVAPVTDADLQDDDAGQDRMHLKIQWLLILLGKAEGCNVWVPESDRSLAYRRDAFATHTLERLPSFGFDENARRIVRNIDVLWLHKRVITKAFEIESTTSIYSGLLRLNDLVLAQPNNNIDLYIAAAAQRRANLNRQLLRPSFEQLIPKCRFMSFENIERLLPQIENLPLDRGARLSGLIEGELFKRPQDYAYGFAT
jgi:hypothetical protein